MLMSLEIRRNTYENPRHADDPGNQAKLLCEKPRHADPWESAKLLCEKPRHADEP